MKKLNQIVFGLIIMAAVGAGCDTMLDVDSGRIMFPEDHRIDTPNDSIYTMNGIFARLQKLADRYVLLGELRGDLMDITENARPDLREINNFEISADNQFNVIEDYYSVINQCNYLINNIDTALTTRGVKSLFKEYAAAKSIRAWTYMQIALNYGTARYYEQPLLTIVDAKADFPEYSVQELVPVLIADLEPVKFADPPGSISLGVDLPSEKIHLPVPLMLGELYLWNGQYENAAREFYRLIEDEGYVVDTRYSSEWTVDNGVFVERRLIDQRFPDIFELNEVEQVTLIAGSTELGEENELSKMSHETYEIAPSVSAINNWENQLYYYNANVTNPGDLRGPFGSYLGPDQLPVYGSYGVNVISKYLVQEAAAENSKAVYLYRIATLYLRYAEAVNRAGKPNLAFAVLKHGMNADAIEVDSIVPRREKIAGGGLIDYVNFNAIVFDQNIGVHARGNGNMELATDYVIPVLATLQDSILYVEDKLIEELALETAFEGSRFTDLMRIAFRRGDPAYLAEKVAAKHTENEQAIRTKLMDPANWYIKF